MGDCFWGNAKRMAPNSNAILSAEVVTSFGIGLAVPMLCVPEGIKRIARLSLAAATALTMIKKGPWAIKRPNFQCASALFKWVRLESPGTGYITNK